MLSIRIISKFLMVLTIAIGLLSATIQPAGAVVENPENCTRWHTVEKGEYLVKIAELYDTSWRSIAEINRLSNPSLIFPNTKLCIFLTGYTPGSTSNTPSSSSNASVYASSVKEDQSVTLQGKNLSTNSRYTVYLGKYNADPSKKILVGSAETDKSGYFKKAFDIPKQLYDVVKIRVSVISATGVSTTNWFINATSNSNTGGTSSGKLAIDVKSVKRNQWVKISTTNLPANVTFKVFMNRAGASWNKAVQVGTLRDSKGGSIVASFDIPASLKDKNQLEIVVFNNPLDMSAEATFKNQTSK